MYESKISDARWIAYDLPGNVGWIAFIACLVGNIRRGFDWYAAVSLVPALLMACGVIELISERVRRLDRLLPKARLYRGFGALTLGGIVGMATSLAGLAWAGDGSWAGWMLAGGALCALFAWLIFREYHPVGEGK